MAVLDDVDKMLLEDWEIFNSRNTMTYALGLSDFGIKAFVVSNSKKNRLE